MNSFATHVKPVLTLLTCCLLQLILTQTAPMNSLAPVSSSPRSIASDRTVPVIGRILWCINEDRQKWVRRPNAKRGQHELMLVQSGEFQCPESNQSKDMKYCCGPPANQHCCKFRDTPGLKWGIAVGVVVSFIIFLTVSYTIQVFRVCDRCYHECPIVRVDSRWYTVSHEGNRYGVTFHSRSFANEFMDCLEAQYGRWNTANMLKIQRDGQDFVILNIFFHDLFTPWFYTQGPIKNDEEWIHTDFKQLCQMVKARLIVKPCFQPLPLCWFKKKSNEMTESDEICPTYSPPHSDETNQLKPKQAHGLERTNSRVYRKWTPWTKVAYIPPSNQSEDRKIPRSSSARKKSWRRSEKYDPNQSVNVFILEDVIECNGLDKGIQTQQTYLRTNELLDV